MIGYGRRVSRFRDRMNSPAPRISEVLLGLAEGAPSERMTVGDIVSALGSRGFSLMFFILGLPNSLPMPPPIALISGFLMVFISLQIVVGRSVPWLPKSVLKNSVSRGDVAKAVQKAMPWVKRIERLAVPRLDVFSNPVTWRALGFALFLVSLALVFALPVVGQIPLGVSLCLIGLGLVEHDGYLVFAGVGVGALGVMFSAGFLAALITGAASIF